MKTAQVCSVFMQSLSLEELQETVKQGMNSPEHLQMLCKLVKKDSSSMCPYTILSLKRHYMSYYQSLKKKKKGTKRKKKKETEGDSNSKSLIQFI